MLKAEGLDVTGVETGSQAVERLRAGERFDLVLTDWKLPGANGLAVLDAAIESDPTLPVLMMTAFGSIETAVEAMKHGAEDFITKPVDPDLLRLMVRRCIERRSRSRQSLLFAEAQSRFLPPIVGDSPAIRIVRAETERVAATDATVLLEARAEPAEPSRGRSTPLLRRAAPFIAINCAAIPETLLESELFGHERGSFTGASARRLGKFELGDTGTIFLDEIGELSPATQGKLLRVLQERSFHRVGGTVPITVDIRIIAASNRPLEKLVAQGAFREDLYYRVRVFPIRIPALRQRPEDMDPVIDGYLEHLPAELGKKPVRLTDAARRRAARLRLAGQRAGAAQLSRAGDHPLRRGRDRRAAPALGSKPRRPRPRGRSPSGRRAKRGARPRAALAGAPHREGTRRPDRAAAAAGLSARRFEAKLREHGLEDL